MRSSNRYYEPTDCSKEARPLRTPGPSIPYPKSRFQDTSAHAYPQPMPVNHHDIP